MQNGDASGDDDVTSEEVQTEPEEASSPLENVVTTAPREVYIVDSIPKAQAALQRLQAIHAANPDTIFACDTEVRLCCSASLALMRLKCSILSLCHQSLIRLIPLATAPDSKA